MMKASIKTVWSGNSIYVQKYWNSINGMERRNEIISFIVSFLNKRLIYEK
jgi:hypothetical protein